MNINENKKMVKEISKHQDSRIKLVNELINGIKVFN